MLIHRVIPCARLLLQHSVGQIFPEPPETHRLIQLPLAPKISLRYLQVHDICQKHCHRLPMKHRRVPILPGPIKEPHIFYHVIHTVDLIVTLKVLISRAVNFNSPHSLALSCPTLLLSNPHYTFVKRIHCRNVA